jgi:hypothetical protein
MDRHGQRQPDANLCPSSADALSVASARAVELAERLPPSTNRYYFWPDDGGAWCHCDSCRSLAPSDQQVLVMNRLLAGLRTVRSDARLSCLAYLDCLYPPRRVPPASGLFLEYAPIRRCYRHALSDPDCDLNRQHAAALPSLIEAFGTDGAQVLEYWLDASMFSEWRRPARQVPFELKLLAADLAFYGHLGFRSVTTFGVFLDAYYFATHGTPPVAEYGHAMAAVDMGVLPIGGRTSGEVIMSALQGQPAAAGT